MNGQAAKKWIWIGAASAAAVWSLLIWGGFALLSLSDEAVAASAGVLGDYPQVHGWLRWAVTVAEDVGSVVLWIAWGVGMVGVLALALFGSWLMGQRRYGDYVRQLAARAHREWS